MDADIPEKGVIFASRNTIYAFTARAELEDPVALARFGFDGFIGKPLAIEALFSAVANAALSPADMSAPAVNAG